MTPSLSSWLWFAAVLALIPLALWLLKRTPLGGAGTSHGAPRTVGMLALSASQKLVTVEVGQGEQRCWLVLGVTPNNIRTLHTMAPPPGSLAAGNPAAPTAFAQIFARLRQPGASSDAR